MEAPLVTVLLPFCNAQHTLDRAVESIVSQTFQRWRLLLIDNNADAKSKLIATNWRDRDARIEIISEPVQGIAHALNAGLSLVNTTFVARMDADDVSLPTRLQKQLKFLESNSEIGLVACRCRFESTSENAEGYRAFVRWQNEIVTSEQHFINRFIESPVAHPSVMFRNALVERFKTYNTGAVPEDYELWLCWMEHAVRFHKLEEELLVWYDDENRLSRTHSNYSKQAFFETKMSFLSRWLKQNADDKKIVVCGTGKLARLRAQLLEQNGVLVFGFTDVKQRGVEKFIPVEKIGEDKNFFYVNFISKRDVRDDVRKLFVARGLVEGNDFILAA